MTGDRTMPSDLRSLPHWNGPAPATGPPRGRYRDPGLRAARESAGLTRGALARACPGLTVRAIRGYEMGERRCPAAVLGWVRAVVGVPEPER